MRLFVALPLGGALAAELRGWLERFGGLGWPVRWVRPEGLHLTLKFLGEVSEAQLPAVESVFDAASAGTPGLMLTAEELGAFPLMRRPRVVWAGLRGDPALELLAHRLESGYASLGFAPEGKAFRPHVTLGRIKEGAWLPGDAAAELEKAQPAGEELVKRAVLYASELGRGGARYREVRAAPLGS